MLAAFTTRAPSTKPRHDLTRSTPAEIRELHLGKKKALVWSTTIFPSQVWLATASGTLADGTAITTSGAAATSPGGTGRHTFSERLDHSRQGLRATAVGDHDLATCPLRQRTNPDRRLPLR